MAARRTTKALAISVVCLASFAIVACVPPAPGGPPGGTQAGVGGQTAATSPPTQATTEQEPPSEPPPEPVTKTPQLKILTQSRSNPVRTAILDTLRNDPQMGSQRGGLFVVRWLAVLHPWAMFQGETEGKRTPVEALLKRQGDEWTIEDFQTTNGTKITHARFPDVPAGVFGPTSFSLAPRVAPEDQLLILTNAKGNSTRSAILDSLRGEFTPQTTFVVEWLRVKNGWAYFMGKTLPYDMPIDAILKRRSSGWDVLLVQGEGDFPESIPDKYAAEAPGAIFP